MITRIFHNPILNHYFAEDQIIYTDEPFVKYIHTDDIYICKKPMQVNSTEASSTFIADKWMLLHYLEMSVKYDFELAYSYIKISDCRNHISKPVFGLLCSAYVYYNSLFSETECKRDFEFWELYGDNNYNGINMSRLTKGLQKMGWQLESQTGKEFILKTFGFEAAATYVFINQLNDNL